MIRIRNETVRDLDARENLLDRVWGAARWQKTAERLREDREPAAGLSFVTAEGRRLIGTVRLWHVCAGPGRPALLLGPLAVEEERRGEGIGAALMQRAVATARRLGHQAVLLVGDAPYYGRFGFSAEKTGGLWLPGPYERHRLLACELTPGALDDARGLVGATGQLTPTPSLDVPVAGLGGNEAGARRAA
jgi:predicted N-acetyltransferase YhbS